MRGLLSVFTTISIKIDNCFKAFPMVLLLFVTSSVLFTACGKFTVSNADLSLLYLDGIAVGDSISLIDASKYTVSNRFPDGGNTVNYEEWRITIDADGLIEKIQASVYDEITLTIGKDRCDSIKEIIDILGVQYESLIYDKEQQLESIVYRDSVNHLQASFVFSTVDNRLVFVIFESTK